MLLSILTVIPAMLMPLAAQSQLAKEKRQVDTSEPSYKYMASAGWSYTSLNQVNQSNNGLQGVDISLMRNFGRYFGVAVDGGHYQWTITRANPASYSVNLFLAGPEVHAPLYDRVSIFGRALLGAAHTGGAPIKPDESFAGGAGVGLEYKLNQRFGIRAYGDDIGSSFTVTPYEPGDSPHRRWNARAGVSVAFHF
jgi:hypothetical protein